MRLTVERDGKGSLGLVIDGTQFVKSLRAEVPAWLDDQTGCAATPWEGTEGKGALGPIDEYISTLRRGGRDILRLSLRNHGTHLSFAADVLERVEGIAQRDSFVTHALRAPAMSLAADLRALAITYGLDDAEDPFAGYWPSAVLCTPTSLPTGAFAPLVLWTDEAAIAIAPASHFLTGSLSASDQGVARGIHGAIETLEAGSRIETLFVPGRDVSSALMALGDELLSRGGKTRPDPSTHLMTSTLGWWNAYGGYYTEPIHPLEERELRRVLDDVVDRELPIGYLGLDLWYPYEQIGQGIEFAPDRAKYPSGIGAISSEVGLPTVLHVSALAQPNAYGSKGDDGKVYRRIGEEIRRQAGQVVWHDWMRTQQHMTAALRSSSEAAEAWYRHMAGELGEHGLEVLQCMQTMGMAFASTAAPNVRGARASIDYLFALPEAMDTLADLGQEGFRREAVAPIQLHRQNLLMGTVLYALGLLPFHDLFLTTFHEGVGGSSPILDATVRALSCGPVGIGDAPGMADRDLLERLLLGGQLLQPDRPPFPDPRTLGEPIELYWTLHEAGEHAWVYVLLLNLSTEAQMYDFRPPLPGDYVARDGVSGSLAETLSGQLEAGAVAYYVLSPRLGSVAPLGLIDKLIPAPAGRIRELKEDNGLELSVRELSGRFAIHSHSSVEVTGDGLPLLVESNGELHTVAVSSEHSTLRIHRR